MKKSLGIWLILLILEACSPKPSNQIQKNDPGKKDVPKADQAEQPNTTAPMSGIDEKDDQIVARLKRAPCFGKCPAFEVALYKNGKAVYIGTKYTPRIGKYEAMVTADFYNRIEKKAREIDYFSLHPEYPVSGKVIKDLPTTVVFFKNNEKSLNIKDNFESPAELQQFELFLQDAFESLDWKAVH